MGDVLPFRPGRYLPPWDHADADWFARNSDRRSRLRRATETETRQAACHHGQLPDREVVTAAVQYVAPGIFVRRFIKGSILDQGEDFARERFERASIPGMRPVKREVA